jgi:hypothetical protein
MTARPSFPLTADGPVLRGPLVYEWDARLEAVPEQSKVEGLAQAVRSAVQPGDEVYVCGSLAVEND